MTCSLPVSDHVNNNSTLKVNMPTCHRKSSSTAVTQVPHRRPSTVIVRSECERCPDTIYYVGDGILAVNEVCYEGLRNLEQSKCRITLRTIVHNHYKG